MGMMRKTFRNTFSQASKLVTLNGSTLSPEDRETARNLIESYLWANAHCALAESQFFLVVDSQCASGYTPRDPWLMTNLQAAAERLK